MSPLGTWVPLAVWLALMVAATSIPNLDTSRYPHADLAFHLAVYLVLAVLTVRWLALMRKWNWRAAIACLAVGLALAGLDEFHERWIPGRTVSRVDFSMNAAGFGLGLVLGNLRYRAKRRG